jgi:CheY-like chemotaxis protein
VVELIVSDCGYGMSEDFVRHELYLPFTQQDPIASGMGLGLSLVKRKVDSLGGTVDIETDRDFGTTAKISIQTRDLVMGTGTHKETDSKSQIPIEIIPSFPKRPKDSLPVMHACFYAPSTWLNRYDKRDERSIDLVFDSLSTTLCEWYQPVLSLWQRQEKRAIPDLVFISQRNLTEFQEECGEKFANVKKVVICAAIGKNSLQDRERILQASTVADTLITGAVLPSKLWKVVTSYFPHIGQPGASDDSQTRNTKSAGIRSRSSSSVEPKEAVDEQNDDYDSSSRGMHPEPDLERQVPDDESTEQLAAAGSETDEETSIEAGANATSADEGAAYRLLRILPAPLMDASKATLNSSSALPTLHGAVKPHLLLVDDNNINLRMLGMFVSKCGIPAVQSTSVPGGQEAIEAFKAFEGSDSTAKSFDIILMDLSMPVVSGFGATSAIRQIETTSGHGHRAYIVALTGLVSDEDRSAAYEAGVDDYVTKPAGLQKVRDIIKRWQKKEGSTLSAR